MCKFKVGDAVRKRGGDDHPCLHHSIVYKITKIEYFSGEYFVQVAGLHSITFFESRFLPNKSKFKGNN